MLVTAFQTFPTVRPHYDKVDLYSLGKALFKWRQESCALCCFPSYVIFIIISLISINFPVPFFRLSFRLFLSFISFSSVFFSSSYLSPSFYNFLLAFFYIRFDPFSPLLHTIFSPLSFFFNPVFCSLFILFTSVHLFSLPPQSQIKPPYATQFLCSFFTTSTYTTCFGLSWRPSSGVITIIYKR
jgi:hypothetical protein